MSLPITSVTYRKDGILKDITLRDINKQSYYEYYKGHLYCPNHDCPARMIYASGNKKTPYFKNRNVEISDGDVAKSEHIEDCPYHVEYTVVEGRVRSLNSQQLIALTPTQIEDMLERIFQQITHPPKNSNNNTNEDKNPKKKKKRVPSQRHIGSGIAGLVSDGAVPPKENSHAPHIIKRVSTELGLKDFTKLRKVYGLVTDWDITTRRNSSITLEGTKNEKVKIYFTENFIHNNENQFKNFHYIQSYLNYLQENNLPALCICIGKIEKSTVEQNCIYVTPEVYNSLRINNLGLYSMRDALVKANYK